MILHIARSQSVTNYENNIEITHVRIHDKQQAIQVYNKHPK